MRSKWTSINEEGRQKEAQRRRRRSSGYLLWKATHMHATPLHLGVSLPSNLAQSQSGFIFQVKFPRPYVRPYSLEPLVRTRLPMPRTKTDAPRGRATWVKGSKLELLMSHMSEWEDAPKVDQRKEFYNRITRLFIALYGYDLPFDDDGPRLCQEDEVPAEGLLHNDGTLISDEEASRRSDIYDKLRFVSTPSPDPSSQHVLILLSVETSLVVWL